MTKVRPPISYELALTKVEVALGSWERVAEIVGVQSRAVRNWSDPDTSAAVTLEKAELLDRAYLEAGGEAPPPFLKAYGLRIGIVTSEQTFGFKRLLDKASAVARESGQAVSAFIRASAPGATLAEHAIARREGQEAIDEMTEMLASLPGREESSTATSAVIPTTNPTSSQGNGGCQ